MRAALVRDARTRNAAVMTAVTAPRPRSAQFQDAGSRVPGVSRMNSRILAVAAAVLSGTAAPAAFAADTTIVSLEQPYTEPQLAAICALENGLPYRGTEGVY